MAMEAEAAAMDAWTAGSFVEAEATAMATAMEAWASGCFAKLIARPALDELHLAQRDAPAASKEDKIEMLSGVVDYLKNMDAAWRETITAHPTATEQILYLLIQGHVWSDIYLFNRENNILLPDLQEDVVDFIVNELKAGGRDSGVTMNIGGGLEEESALPYYSGTPPDLMNGWLDIDRIIERLEGLRDCFNGLPRVSIPAKEARHSSKIELAGGKPYLRRPEKFKDRLMMNGVKDREKSLEDILRRLSEGRRARFYAPPAGKELVCYREIRKWVTSTLTFLSAKDSWLQSWLGTGTLSPRELTGAPACRDLISVERVQQCSGDWEFLTREGFASVIEFHAPCGRQTAMVFDELPEFQSLLSCWKGRFSEITNRFSETNGELMSARVTSLDGVYTGVDGREGTRVQEEQANKRRKQGVCAVEFSGVPAQSCKPRPGQVPKTMDRGKCLVNILSALEGMKASSSLQSRLSVREVRLYAKILEHVRSSIWLFENRATPEERQQYAQIICSQRKGDEYGAEYEPSNYNIQVPEKLKGGTTEEYLEEIVSLIEKIDSEFLFSTPKAEEKMLYQKVLQHMNVDLQESSFYLKREVEGNTSGTGLHHELEVAAESVLKAIWAREVQVAGELAKEFDCALRTIFTRAPELTKVTEWLEENADVAMADLRERLRRSPLGPEFLDSLLFSLHELDELIMHVIERLAEANDNLYHFVKEEDRLQVQILEGWAAMSVLKSFKEHGV